MRAAREQPGLPGYQRTRYADDLDAGEKNVRARALISDALTEANGVLSTQVLQEFFSITTRKLRVPADVARRKVELLATLEVMRIDVDGDPLSD